MAITSLSEPISKSCYPRNHRYKEGPTFTFRPTYELYYLNWLYRGFFVQCHMVIPTSYRQRGVEVKKATTLRTRQLDTSVVSGVCTDYLTTNREQNS